MDFAAAIRNIRLGESLRSIAAAFRAESCARAGIDPKEAPPGAFAVETADYMRGLCRELGDRHAGDVRVGQALRDWVGNCRDYEAWDALLSSFDFEGRTRYLEQGRRMFPGTMTSHWQA